MSFLRALRAYVGLGPDDEIEQRYLADLNDRRRALDLDALDGDSARSPGGSRRERTRRSPLTESRRAAGFGYGFDGPEEDGRGVFGESGDPGDDRPGRSEPVDPDDRYDFEADIETEHGLLDDESWVEEEADVDDGTVIDLTADDGRAEIQTAKRGPGGWERSEDRPVSTAHHRDRGEVDGGPHLGDDLVDDDRDFGVVRSLDAIRAKPRTLMPESFADAKVVADEFKRGIPVLLNLQAVDRALARRLVDFASGVCYALDGSMEKVASQVFLLIPEGAEVSDDDRRRILERGYAR